MRNHGWKTAKAETEKKQLITRTLTKNIKKFNELIYAVLELVCDKIGAPFKNTNRNTKPGWKIRLETQIGNLRKTAEMIR